MKNRAEMVLEVPAKEAENIIAALEKEGTQNRRFSSRISIREKKLVIKIEAEDIVALRAAVNSYLRYLQTMESMENAEL